MENLNIVFMNENAKMMTRGTTYSAGNDMYAAENVTIAPNKRKLISTGIKMAIPVGYYGRIASRSGLAYKNSIDVCAGVIDADYRDEVKVLLHNSGSEPFEVKIGDRIGQIIFEKYYNFNFEQVSDLNDTDRKAGFGSTGR
jgi:dUTP pyrophosphatase